MSIIHKADVSALWFRNADGERVHMPITVGSLTRIQASDLLREITKGIPQRTNDCGFTAAGGECRMWW